MPGDQLRRQNFSRQTVVRPLIFQLKHSISHKKKQSPLQRQPLYLLTKWEDAWRLVRFHDKAASFFSTFYQKISRLQNSCSGKCTNKCWKLSCRGNKKSQKVFLKWFRFELLHIYLTLSFQHHNVQTFQSKSWSNRQFLRKCSKVSFVHFLNSGNGGIITVL